MQAVIRWIRTGEWNSEDIDAEIKYIIDRDRAMEPKDIVRTHRIIDIEEEVIERGFPEILQMAYNGELTIDEYVNFIQNSYLARTYQAPVPDIEWSKIQTGLKKKIDFLLQKGIEQSHTRMFIRNAQKQYFTEDEWDTYEMISQIQEKPVLMFKMCVSWIF